MKQRNVIPIKSLDDNARFFTGKAPVNCSYCCKPIINIFVDGQLLRGPWADLCPKCFAKYGMPLTESRPNIYQRTTSSVLAKRWVKVIK